MKHRPLAASAVALLVLALAGCESDGGIAARSHEKADVYASLNPRQKKCIDRGSVAVGFTPDMVYIALGKPDVVKTQATPKGKDELWTYKRYYPSSKSLHGFQYAKFSPESAYQPQPVRTYTVSGRVYPVGVGPGQSITTIGGPQGGSMEPANLKSYTVQVLFGNGAVTQLGLTPNLN
jgi:hypothetical protein